MNRLPLSLLDLLACGFGSVILLFFVTIIAWENMAETEATSFLVDKESGSVPFVCIVMPTDDSKTLENDGAALIWKVERPPHGFEWGQDSIKEYSVLYANQTPRCRTTLEGLPAGISVTGKTFINGKQIDWETQTQDGTLCLTEGGMGR